MFVYPGDIPEGGLFEGKSAIEGWFRGFFGQFPKINFDIKAICVRDIFTFSHINVISVHWGIKLTNRNGRIGQNSGVTVINIVGGKVSRVKDFIFDIGDNFRLNWGAKQ